MLPKTNSNIIQYNYARHQNYQFNPNKSALRLKYPLSSRNVKKLLKTGLNIIDHYNAVVTK